MTLYKKTTIFLFLFFAIHVSYAQSYKKLHERSIVVDTHNDIINKCLDRGYSFDNDLSGKTHSDLQRFKQGGIDVQVFSIWCDGKQLNPFKYANRQIDTLYATALRNPDKMQIVFSSRELMRTVKKKKLAAMIGVEGGHMMESDLDKLDSLYKRGARYMTLTWNNSSPWATSAMAETRDSALRQPKGLNEFGKSVVRRMNELGMLVDLSHVGEQTFWDAINTTTKPVLISHSCVYTLCHAFRNLKDDQIKAIGKNGGVIHLNFYSGFLDSTYEKKDATFSRRHKAERDSLLKINSEPYFANEYLYEKYKDEVQAMKAPFHLLFDHLDYIVKLIGVDHVGLGSDFDGINSTPQHLNGVTDFPLITKELLARGYGKKDITKILGGNFLSLLKANEN
ncbi:MAG TPA: dipeptidase [Chitinophagaceae bacterium]|nr:dipeptidase [Chitinophagaceae bacterium]